MTDGAAPAGRPEPCVIQCAGCGDDIIIARGPERMCARCQRIGRDGQKKQAAEARKAGKAQAAKLVPLYDSRGFCTGSGNVWYDSGAGGLTPGWYVKSGFSQRGPFETRQQATGTYARRA